MTPSEARDLVAYDEWANARLLDAAATLPVDRQEEPLGGSFGSVRALVAHIVGAEWIWLMRWRGENPAAPEWLGEPVAALRPRLAAVEAERGRFLAGLPDEALSSVVEYRLLDGTPGARRLDELVRHAVNHSTYHRGQLADMLRRLGVAPPSTDLLLFR